jgi:hypothetical protein
VTPWIVFTSHRPLYTAACSNLPLQHACQIESPVFLALQAAWEDVLIKFNVTLAATAHIHYYERTCPVAHGVCIANLSHTSSAAETFASLLPVPAPAGAPIYVVVGPAGACILHLFFILFKAFRYLALNLFFIPACSSHLCLAGAPITPLPAPPHPSWTAALIDVFGFSVIHSNATHFHFQFTADGSGQVLDEFMFTLPA